jgi:hypothetical protein
MGAESPVIDPYARQKEIEARFKAALPSHLIPYVFTGSVPDGKAIPLYPDGKVRPHFVINFAGITEPNAKVNGITGAQDDSFMQGFQTHGIGADDDAARQVNSLGLGAILGFQPTGCGQIRPAFFAGVGEISSLSSPTRYSAVQAYRFLMNP